MSFRFIEDHREAYGPRPLSVMTQDASGRKH